MPKQEKNIFETMKDIERMSNCILANNGYKNWQDVPPMEDEKSDENL